MTPTLIVSAANTGVPKLKPAAVAAAISDRRLIKDLRCNDMSCIPALKSWFMQNIHMERDRHYPGREKSTSMLHCTTHAKHRAPEERVDLIAN